MRRRLGSILPIKRLLPLIVVLILWRIICLFQQAIIVSPSSLSSQQRNDDAIPLQLSFSRQHHHHQHDVVHEQGMDAVNHHHDNNNNNKTFTTMNQPSHARFVLGIVLRVTDEGRRTIMRRAFDLYHDPRVCSFGGGNGQVLSPPPASCELAYTFVVGGNPNGATQIVKTNNHNHIHHNNHNNHSSSMSPMSDGLLAPVPKRYIASQQPNDTTFLNIRVSAIIVRVAVWSLLSWALTSDEIITI